MLNDLLVKVWVVGGGLLLQSCVIILGMSGMGAPG